MTKKFIITGKGNGEFANDSLSEITDGQILCKPISVGLCGTDRLTFNGEMPAVKYPIVPGHEVVATVIKDYSSLSLTPGTTIFIDPYKNCGKCHACKVGRYNCCKNNQTLGVQRDGILREQFLAEADRVYLLPQTIDNSLFCLAEPLALAIHIVQRAGDVKDRWCLVAGAGNVGRLVIKVLSNFNAKIIAWDISDNRLEDAKKFGAHFTINSMDKDAFNLVNEITEGEGPTVTFETAGQGTTVEDCIKMTAFAGKMIIVGHSKQVSNFHGSDIVFKELDILGSRNSQGQFQNAINMIASDPKYWSNFISHRFPFDKSLEAFQLTQNNDVPYTKIVIDF